MKSRALSMQVASLGICSLTMAQIKTFSPQSQNDIFYSITVPERTATSGSGPVLFQIRAPTTLEWVALGQGTRMAGADIYILYASSSRNVTISPRSGTDHIPPKYNPQAQVSLLEGSGIQDGLMTANVRCDSCSYSSNSPWIFAFKGGQPLNSNDMEAGISFHDDFGNTRVELSNAVSAVANPLLGYDPSSPSNQPAEVGGNAENAATLLIAHGVIMSVAFLLLFPSFALMTAIPIPGIIVKVHGPLQILTLFLAIAGMALGIKLGTDKDIMDDAHPILGLVLLGLLVMFQPAMGLVQHLHFRRNGGKGAFAYLHRWLGRLSLILGMVTGGLGFRLAGIGSPKTLRSGVIAYSVIAGVVGFFYIAIQVFRAAKEKGGSRGLAARKNSERRTESGSNSNDLA
ncbi:hypothetical protein BJX61DRAFT_536652 [Aspergillus egyptiacus]|nr:hypothetical protein BJX61DRAFT_536652 [Aspergillus egyptiacus]